MSTASSVSKLVKTKGGSQYQIAAMNWCYIARVFVLEDCTRSPFDKYAGLYGVDNAAESRFLFVASQHQAHLAGEGGGQPVSHL